MTAKRSKNNEIELYRKAIEQHRAMMEIFGKEYPEASEILKKFYEQLDKDLQVLIVELIMGEKKN